MLVLWRSLNGRHQRTAQRKKGAEWKQQCLAVEEERSATSRAFRAYGIPLEMVTSFIYLGRVMSEADYYWLEALSNLVKAWVVWRRITGIIIWEGARLQVSEIFFKATVQTVLIFGAETWVIAPHMGRILGGIQDQVAQRLMVQLLRRRSDGLW